RARRARARTRPRARRRGPSACPTRRRRRTTAASSAPWPCSGRTRRRRATWATANRARRRSPPHPRRGLGQREDDARNRAVLVRPRPTARALAGGLRERRAGVLELQLDHPLAVRVGVGVRGGAPGARLVPAAQGEVAHAQPQLVPDLLVRLDAAADVLVRIGALAAPGDTHPVLADDGGDGDGDVDGIGALHALLHAVDAL